jgi:hypothetical protein
LARIIFQKGNVFAKKVKDNKVLDRLQGDSN